MRNLAFKSTLIISLTTLLFSTKSIAQEDKTKVIQDPKFEQLLKEKQKINASIAINNSYKIQIFYGNGSEAEKKRAEFVKNYKDIEATIVYANPTFKVYVGSYKSRLHAEKALTRIKEKYPTALLIKPGK
jgi:cell division protein FtsN